MSVLTEGILMMQSTLVGIIRIDPKTLLENGIRKELLRQLTITLTSAFTQPQRRSLENKLEQIGERVDGIRRSFEYIGDYVNSHGLKIFQEEFSRLLNFATEQECNAWKKVKVLSFQSLYQSKEVPIQLTVLEDPTVVTFLGRLVNEVLALSKARSTVFVDDTSSWYDIKTHNPQLSPDTFKLIERAIDIVGLVGLDRVVSFHCVKELEVRKRK
jgi:WASH complex subunit strumpellin